MLVGNMYVQRPDLFGAVRAFTEVIIRAPLGKEEKETKVETHTEREKEREREEERERED